MDVSRPVRPPDCFPFCVVWTPIPVVTWLLPFVGHVGVCSSKGSIMEFVTSYCIQRGRLSFGDPTRFVQMKAESLAWDAALEAARQEYCHNHTYNFCSDNCHCFAADALNRLSFTERRWTMVSLAALIFFRGKHVGWQGFMLTWLPFVLVLAMFITVITVLV